MSEKALACMGELGMYSTSPNPKFTHQCKQASGILHPVYRLHQKINRPESRRQVLTGGQRADFVVILFRVPTSSGNHGKPRERSGRVLDSRPKGRGFEPHRRHCVVSLSKNINPSLVLVHPRKTRPFITERLLMRRKESNQTNMENLAKTLKKSSMQIMEFEKKPE